MKITYLALALLPNKYLRHLLKEHVVLIRKTTVIWLFQEIEHVPADCLFRVRLKQPYALICTPKSASTAVVQCDDMTGKDDLKNSKSDDITGKDDITGNGDSRVAK